MLKSMYTDSPCRSCAKLIGPEVAGKLSPPNKHRRRRYIKARGSYSKTLAHRRCSVVVERDVEVVREQARAARERLRAGLDRLDVLPLGHAVVLLEVVCSRGVR